MIPNPDVSRGPNWGRALLIVGGVHMLAIGALFVRIQTPADLTADMPAIAVEMAPPAALPAPVHDVPTPRQIEAPNQTPQEQPKPKKPPFDPPPLATPDARPEVVVPLQKKAAPMVEKANPLPPAPTTTEAAAPDLKPDTKTAALLTGGAAMGKSTPDALWDAKVRARIELTKRYPGGAARLDQQQDNVDVLITIDRKGRLLDSRIRRSRGFTLIDDAALEAVRDAAPYPKPPKEVEGEIIRLSVVVRFSKRVR